MSVYIISVIFSIGFLITVIELIRKNKLQERYSIIWIIMSIILFILSVNPIFIEVFSRWLNIKNPPSFLFLFGLVYLIIYNLHSTVVISRQSEMITRLSQEVALLNMKKNKNSEK